jgi:hypothetical protein
MESPKQPPMTQSSILQKQKQKNIAGNITLLNSKTCTKLLYLKQHGISIKTDG